MAVDTAHELPLATLVRRLDPSSLARRMVTEFSTQIPAYGRLPDPDAAGGILEMSRRNLELFIECVVADRSPTREELEPFCRSARQRASEGMPLEDLLAAYRMGGRLGWREMSASAQPGEQDALIELAERTMHYIDRVSAAVAQSYLDARQHHVSFRTSATGPQHRGRVPSMRILRVSAASCAFDCSSLLEPLIIMEVQEFPISVADVDAGGKAFTFPIRAAWVRGVLEDHTATTTGKDGEIDVRVSIIPMMHGEGIVMRLLDKSRMVFNLKNVGMPAQMAATFHELISLPHGIVLVTGPTGSGKTTTLASMINIINEERDEAHIITVEDPIEYYHKHKKAVITQREVNVDVPNFAEALRRALRQDPDVILVGELRDLETMEAAITAAETGHLVFGTLHTTGAAKTIDRITNAFPTNQQEMIRIQLSTVLQAVISQLLLPRVDKPGRVAIFEIMVNTPSIGALIRDNKTFRIQSDIQTGANLGMITLDTHLMSLVNRELVSPDEAFETWLKSSRGNLVHPEVKFMGVATTSGRWVLVLGTR